MTTHDTIYHNLDFSLELHDSILHFSKTDGKFNKTYLVKIDDDFKIITNNVLSEIYLLEIIKLIYPNKEITLHKLANNINTLLHTMIDHTSFLTNNEINYIELIDRLNTYSELLDYFNKLNINADLLTKTTENKISISNHQLVSIPTRGQIVSLDIRDVPNINDNSNINELGVDESIGYSSTDYVHFEDFNNSLLNNENYNIYYNNQFNNIFIIESHKDSIYNAKVDSKIFPELIFMLHINPNENQLPQILKLKEDVFVDLLDARSKIDYVLDEKIINSKLSITEIKGLIDKYFSVNTNYADRIKFSDIWNIILSEIKVSKLYINYIKRQLPVILIDLGLQKKRKSDGIYWYGLVKKKIVFQGMATTLPTTISIDKNKITNYENVSSIVPDLSSIVSHREQELNKLTDKPIIDDSLNLQK